MKVNCKILVLFLLSIHFSYPAATSSNKNEIIDADHYFSESSKSHIYDLNDLKKEKPIVVVIKASGDSAYDNKITVSLESGKKKKECQFSSFEDLCVLEDGDETKGKLEIKCEKLPCDAYWKVYQPTLNKLINSEKVSNLYEIQKDMGRFAVSLQCNSVNEKENNINSEAKVFSSLPFSIFHESHRHMYVIFDSVNAGYLYFVVDPKYKGCLSFRIIRGVDRVEKDGDFVEDILKKGHKNTYSLSDVPDGQDFRFDFSFHHPQKEDGSNSKAVIEISGIKDSVRETIRSNSIEMIVTHENYDISYAVPKINTSIYKDIQLEIESDATSLLFGFVFRKESKIEVEALEYSFFDLKKGEKLSYRLVGERKADEFEKLSISASDSKIHVSEKECSFQEGCDFELEAEEDIKGNIFIGTNRNTEEDLILDFGEENTFTHKIRDSKSIYIHKKFAKEGTFQVSINTPNVLLYLASKKVCDLPSVKCYERIGNIDHRIIFTVKEENEDILFYVQALDNCEFTITLLGDDARYVELVDSQAFVYLFDEHEEELIFRFFREGEVDVNFNLVAPLHSLDLIVENGNELPDDKNSLISAEGFILYEASQAPKDDFTIIVRKRPEFLEKFVHFTMIASTFKNMIRLESGISYYQTLQPVANKDTNNAQYIFEFDPQEDYILNFYVHNTKEEEIKINLKLTAFAENKEKEIFENLQIDRSEDVLDLHDISETLCLEIDDEGSCEIGMELANVMDVEVDVIITLLTKHNILELKDGLWQIYDLNEIATSAHFYFRPRNIENDVGINFKTSDPSIRIKYRLFDAGGDRIDPSSWPFPSETLTEDDLLEQEKFKPINHFSISKDLLKVCWPDCVVLVSLINIESDGLIKGDGSFSLMGSNSIMELLEKEKIDVTLKEGENKLFMLDLKYALKRKEDIYFNAYHSIGLTFIKANVYGSNNNRVPDEETFDFSLDSEKEIKIEINKIQEIIENEDMGADRDLYLFLLVSAASDSKLSMEFRFDEPGNGKLLSLDTMEHVVLSPDIDKIFYLPLDQVYEIKINRLSGFPFYTSNICNKTIDECLEEFTKLKFKGEQILGKVQTYTAAPCERCYYLFKVSTESDPSEINIHLQSRMSEVELTENKPLSDFTKEGESNKYLMYAIRGEDIYINIHVSEGEVEVDVTDLHRIRNKQSGNKIISFIIPGEATSFSSEKLSDREKELLQRNEKSLESIKYLKKENPLLSQAIMSAFGLSDKFVELHVLVKSVNNEKPSIYTISYSSGTFEFELQDGLITDYNVEPGKEATFYYSSKTAGHVYFTLSMDQAAHLKDLDISFKYCVTEENIISDECWTEYNIEKPPIKEHTPNPTMMYSLIDKNHLSISLKYKGEKPERVSLGINHREIMLLPFEVEFPFILHKNESISFLVEVSNAGYIEIFTRKCDESSPMFYYTFDYSAFQNDEFTYQTLLSSDPKNRFVSKVQPSTLYMKMRTSPEEQAMLSVYVRYSQEKISDADIYAGNKGKMEYEIVDSYYAELKIKPPTCSDYQCGEFKYYLMVATEMRDLYSQLICPSNFFSNLEFESHESVPQEEVIPEKNENGYLLIRFAFKEQISYVGIRAETGESGRKRETYYKPIEVATVWGQFSRTSQSHKIVIGGVFIIGFAIMVFCVRRSARKGYRPIGEEA